MIGLFLSCTIDLTHALHSAIPCWNFGSCAYHMAVDNDTRNEEMFGFYNQTFTMSSSAGTHMDSPAHCYAEGATIGELSLDSLVRPVRVLHLREKSHESFVVSVDDLLAYEKEYGQIEAGEIVLFDTGWSERWETPSRYHNEYRYPSLSGEIAQLLVERDVSGIGIDTFSPDVPGTGWPVHHIILGAGKYIIENMTNLDRVPARGALLIVLPLNHQHAGESPVRAVAVIE